MSINSDMKFIMLQKRVEIPTQSGAKKYEWVDDREILVALYLLNDMKNTQSVQYNESSHTGLTWYKDISKAENRLKNGNTIYTLNKVNPNGRLTKLFLKVVGTNV